MNIYDFYITPEEYELAAKNGITPTLLEVRVRSLGWEKARAINTQPHTKKALGEWVGIAEANGICYSTLRYRANRLGWDIERAATQSLQDRQAQAKRAYENSRKYSKELKDLAIKNGIKERTFHRRVKSGWDPLKAANTPTMTPREVGLLTKDKRQKELSIIFAHKITKNHKVI